MKLYYNKTINENVNLIYNEIKKMKHKIEGAENAIKELKEKYEKRKKQVEIKQKTQKMFVSKKYWFQKFRWFILPNATLVVGGKDATTNEILIKKHLDKNDIVFHTEMPGSPFVIMKRNFELPDDIKLNFSDYSEENSLEDIAVFTASFSRAWRNGITNLEVYWVNPDQVSKTMPSGEYAGKGSFMIYGKKNLMNATLELAIGKFKNIIMIGPKRAIEHLSPESMFLLYPSLSGLKMSEVANKIAKFWKVDQSEILQLLPSGKSIMKLHENQKFSK